MIHRTRSLLLSLVGAGSALAIGLAGCGSATSTTTTTPSSTGGAHSGHAPASAVPAAALRDGERFLDLSMTRPYQPSAPNGGTDEYRCLIVDPGLTEPAFLTGSQFQPRNVPIAHHALVFVIGPEDAAAARAKDAETPGDGWTCFGNSGLDTGNRPAWVDTWTPNATETLLQQDVGFPMGAGSLLVLQIHYNLLATNGEPGATDQAGIRLRLKSGTSATKPLDTAPLDAPIELPCAPGESGPLCDRDAAIADVAKRFGEDVGGNAAELVARCDGGVPTPGDTQSCDTSVPRAVTVYAAMGHMHLLGRAIKVELNPDTPAARTLLDVPEFDFDNQKMRPLPTPVEVGPGDTLRVTCSHDATLRQKLPQLKTLPPRYVVYGDGTSDEMCLGLLIVSPTG